MWMGPSRRYPERRLEMQRLATVAWWGHRWEMAKAVVEECRYSNPCGTHPLVPRYILGQAYWALVGNNTNLLDTRCHLYNLPHTNPMGRRRLVDDHGAHTGREKPALGERMESCLSVKP